MIAGLGLDGAVLLPAQVSAEPKIYAYPASANFCPAGLQPVTISGVICLRHAEHGTSYQQDDVAPRAEKATRSATITPARH